MELQVNKAKWEALPADVKSIVKHAAMAEALHYTLKMLDRNSQDLVTLVTKHGVTVVESPLGGS